MQLCIKICALFGQEEFQTRQRRFEDDRLALEERIAETESNKVGYRQCNPRIVAQKSETGRDRSCGGTAYVLLLGFHV